MKETNRILGRLVGAVFSRADALPPKPWVMRTAKQGEGIWVEEAIVVTDTHAITQTAGGIIGGSSVSARKVQALEGSRLPQGIRLRMVNATGEKAVKIEMTS